MKTKNKSESVIDKKIFPGVNLPEGPEPSALRKQIEYLISAISASFDFTDEERNTVINDTVIKILQKQADGSIPKYPYATYKGYAFIVLNNNVLAYWNTKHHKSTGNKSYVFNDRFANIDEVDTNDYYEKDIHLVTETISIENKQLDLLSEAIKQLSKNSKRVIDEFLKTGNRNRIIEKFGSEQILITVIDELKLIIQVNNRINNTEVDLKRKSYIIKTSLQKEIRTLFVSGHSKSAISRKLNISLSKVSYYTNPNVKKSFQKYKKRIKANLPSEVIKPDQPIAEKANELFKPEHQLKDKCMLLFSAGYTKSDIARFLGCSRSTVRYNVCPENRKKKKYQASKCYYKNK